MNNDKLCGSVKWFNEKKGYGFITCANIEGDVFFHYSQIHTHDNYKTLSAGEEVEFTLVVTTKGQQAQRVVRAKAGGSNG